MKKLFVPLFGIALILLLPACSGDTASQQNTDSAESEASHEEKQQNEKEQQTNEIPEFTEEKALELMKDYKESFVSLINEAGSNEKITSFNTTEEVQNHFKTVMSDDLASWMTDTYFKEAEDGVHVIPKDAPTWLKEDQPFEIKSVSDTHKKIVQERNNELIGHVNMIYHATFQEKQDSWVVQKIENENLNAETNQTNDENNENADSKNEEVQNSVKEAGRNVLDSIARQDMETFSKYVHPEKGVLFSPYVYIDENDLTFSQNETEHFFSPDSKVYEWGTYDGRGNPIELTPSEYFGEFVYDKNFQEADEILINEMKQRGNVQNNIKEAFPDATVIEYHVKGEEEGGMDWASLNLVFEKDSSDEWKLVAVVHDQWTV